MKKMSKVNRLSLRRERLEELTSGELSGVAGGAETVSQLVNPCVSDLVSPCVTRIAACQTLSRLVTGGCPPYTWTC